MDEADVDPRTRAAETKKRRTRERAVFATLELFGAATVEEKEDAPTIEEIAEEAGIGVATIYTHFGTKYGLYSEALKQLFDPLERPIKTAIEAGAYRPVDFRAEIVSYLARSASLLLAHRQLLASYVQAYFETRQHELRMNEFASFVAEGLISIMKAEAEDGVKLRFAWGYVDYYLNSFVLRLCERYGYFGLDKTDARTVVTETLQLMLPVVDTTEGLGDFSVIEAQLDKILAKKS